LNPLSNQVWASHVYKQP